MINWKANLDKILSHLLFWNLTNQSQENSNHPNASLKPSPVLSKHSLQQVNHGKEPVLLTLRMITVSVNSDRQSDPQWVRQQCSPILQMVTLSHHNSKDWEQHHQLRLLEKVSQGWLEGKKIWDWPKVGGTQVYQGKILVKGQIHNKNLSVNWHRLGTREAQSNLEPRVRSSEQPEGAS